MNGHHQRSRFSEITPGTYLVGRDIAAGTYRGETGTGTLDSCYWERLSGVSGEFDDLIANGNEVGQFYVEILPTDKYFKVDCDIIPLDKWPPPAVPFSEITPGTYLVGRDIVAGTYRGETGTGTLDSCYWERLSGVSGEFDDLIANGNEVGQFYVEILPTDKYFKVDCDIIPLDKWPPPAVPFSEITPGTYLVGRDIVAGTYRGETGTGTLDSCYWERLSGVSGEFDDLIANDNATGQFFVSVKDTDYVLSTSCALELVEP